MYIIYTDESGDTGMVNSPSDFFVLSGLAIHESNWANLLDDLVEFRRHLKARYGLLIREEIHASVFINGRPGLKGGADRNKRMMILRDCLDWLNARNDISIVTLRYDKRNKGQHVDVFDVCWRFFLQRIDNTLHYNNFPGPYNGDKAIIVSDNTDVKKLTQITRKMRRYNQVSNQMGYGSGFRNIPLRTIIKDPIFRDSKNSLMHQMIDVVVYYARQTYECNNYNKKKGGKGFYANRLTNVTNPHVTKYPTINNIVEL